MVLIPKRSEPLSGIFGCIRQLYMHRELFAARMCMGILHGAFHTHNSAFFDHIIFAVCLVRLGIHELNIRNRRAEMRKRHGLEFQFDLHGLRWGHLTCICSEIPI